MLKYLNQNGFLFDKNACEFSFLIDDIVWTKAKHPEIIQWFNENGCVLDIN